MGRAKAPSACSRLKLIKALVVATLIAATLFLAKATPAHLSIATSEREIDRGRVGGCAPPKTTNGMKAGSGAGLHSNEAGSRFARTRRRANAEIAANPSAKPEFAAPIGNVSAVLGRDVRLVCEVDHLGHHQVAWLKEETKTILSIDTNMVITNYRIFLIPDEEGRKWVLFIRDVQESDRGFYQCQINTNPPLSTSGYLDVVVPPTIIESETSQAMDVVERSNVSLQCRANGHPRPTISWRREDGEPIRLNGANRMLAGGESATAAKNRLNSKEVRQEKRALQNDKNFSPDSALTFGRVYNTDADQQSVTHLYDIRSDRLFFTNVDRSMAGLYVCSASNGIQSQASKQIPLYVKFPPKVSVAQKLISVALGEQLEIDCLIEAFPKPTSYWSERQFLKSLDRIVAMSGNHTGKVLKPPLPRTGFNLLLPKQSAVPLAGGHHLRKLRQLGNGEPKNADQSSTPKANVRLRGAVFIGKPRLPSDMKTRQVGNLEDQEQAGDYGTEGGEGDAQSVAESSLSLNNPSSWMTQDMRDKLTPEDKTDLDQAYVTVKQTALNSYTYKLKISIARMRLSDFGEYVCISSNLLGTSSAKVFVTRSETNQAPSAAAVHGASKSKSLSLTEAADNQADYQHDAMSNPTSVWNGQQLIQAPKSIWHQPSRQTNEARPANHLSGPSKQTNRVYDEHYLQSIRSRQSANGYIMSTSGSAQILSTNFSNLTQAAFGNIGGKNGAKICYARELLLQVSIACSIIFVLYFNRGMVLR